MPAADTRATTSWVAEALRLLQEREAEKDRTHANGETGGSEEEEMAVSQRSVSVLDIFREAREAS